MKAITIWQPWAQLIACGVKKFETRSWETSYRGPIAIHAAKKSAHEIFSEYIEHDTAQFILGELSKFDFFFPKDLPHGCIVATADLVNCWHIVYNPGTDIDIAKHIPIGAELNVPRKHPDFHKYIVPTEQEMLIGDWTPGRYAWELENVKVLEEPIPAKGNQRIWNFGT